MANERYKHLSDIVQETFILGCPVAIEKGALLSDTVNNTTILRLRLKNASKKSIKFLSISAFMYDDANDSLIKSKFQEFAYLDLAVKPQDSFGDNQANILLDPNTRKVKIIFNKVVFTNEEVWRNDAQEIGVNFPEQELIEKIGSDLLSQCKREFESSGMSGVSFQNIKFIPILQDEYWQCSCGFPNNNEDKSCLYCGMNKEWIFKNTDIIGLTQKLKEYNKKQEELSEKQRIEKARLAEENKVQEEIQKEKARLRKKKLKIILPIVGTLVVLFIVIVTVIMPEIKQWNLYNQAIEFMNNENYDESTSIFTSLGNYKETEDYLKQIDYIKAVNLMNKENYLAAKEIFNKFNDYKDTKKYLEEINLKLPKNLVAQNYKNNLIAMESHALGLKSDGTVIAGDNSNFKDSCKVTGWSDIIAIAASDAITVGLKWDGTVVSTDFSKTVQSDLSTWSDITAIICDDSYIFGLKSDGTVVATSADKSSNPYNVSDWININAIFCNGHTIFGLKRDGTVLTAKSKVSIGSPDYGQTNVSNWTNIATIYPTAISTIGLKTDGTVVSTDGRDNVSEWTDVIAVSCSTRVTIGKCLKR